MLSWNLFFIRRLHDADVKSFPVEKAQVPLVVWRRRERGESSSGESFSKGKFVYTDKIPRDRFDGVILKYMCVLGDNSWDARSLRLPATFSDDQFNEEACSARKTLRRL